MTRRRPYLEAVLESAHIGLPLDHVDRVLRAVQVHAVPGGPGCLLGSIDVAGELVPVYDTRKLLGLPTRALRADDRIVLTRSPLRCGLVVDDVAGTVEPEAVELSGEFGMHAAGLRGVARGSRGLLLVHDLKRLLALERAIPISAHA